MQHGELRSDRGSRLVKFFFRLSRQWSHCSTSWTSSSSSPTVAEIQTREREDRIESEISPVTVSTTADEKSGRPDIDKANKIFFFKKKKNHRKNGETRCVLKSRSGCKNSEKIWWMVKFHYSETQTPVLLMKCLQSPHQREVRICVNTVFYTHFPEDRNCEICKRTQITRAPCRRRNGATVLRAEILVTW